MSRPGKTENIVDIEAQQQPKELSLFMQFEDLKVMLSAARAGGKTPHSVAQLSEELHRRNVRRLAVKMCKPFEALTRAFSRDFGQLEKKLQKGRMSLTVHEFMSIYDGVAEQFRGAASTLDFWKMYALFHVRKSASAQDEAQDGYLQRQPIKSSTSAASEVGIRD